MLCEVLMMFASYFRSRYGVRLLTESIGDVLRWLTDHLKILGYCIDCL